MSILFTVSEICQGLTTPSLLSRRPTGIFDFKSLASPADGNRPTFNTKDNKLSAIAVPRLNSKCYLNITSMKTVMKKSLVRHAPLFNANYREFDVDNNVRTEDRSHANDLL